MLSLLLFLTLITTAVNAKCADQIDLGMEGIMYTVGTFGDPAWHRGFRDPWQTFLGILVFKHAPPSEHPYYVQGGFGYALPNQLVEGMDPHLSYTATFSYTASFDNPVRLEWGRNIQFIGNISLQCHQLTTTDLDTDFSETLSCDFQGWDASVDIPNFYFVTSLRVMQGSDGGPYATSGSVSVKTLTISTSRDKTSNLLPCSNMFN